MTLPQRFWDKVAASTIHFYKYTPCWDWVSCTSIVGYGQFWLNGKTEYAYRVSYEDVNGKIPKELELDHLCRNKKCVNPDHLQAVTHKENVRRGLAGFVIGLRQRIKTHCPQGHEYTKENTYIMPAGGRYCRTCKLIRNCQNYQKRKMR